MYYLACCDDNGTCIGFLTVDKTVCSDPNVNPNYLMSFKRKRDSNETVMQINLSRLLPNGYPFRVVAVQG